jgi:hypothetical protein
MLVMQEELARAQIERRLEHTIRKGHQLGLLRQRRARGGARARGARP